MKKHIRTDGYGNATEQYKATKGQSKEKAV